MESVLMEATPRLELGNKGFADLCLTTWLCRRNWSGLRGSNSLPPPWQGGALPDELQPHFLSRRTHQRDIYYSKKGVMCQAKNEIILKNFIVCRCADDTGVKR